MQVVPPPPLMRNNSISMEALHAHNNTAKLLSDNVRDKIIKALPTVGDAEIKVAAETIERLNPDKRTTRCERALEVWDSTDIVRLGWIDRAATTWRWCTNALRTLGITTEKTEPGATPRAYQHDEEKGVDRQDDDMQTDEDGYKEPAERYGRRRRGE